MKAKVTIVDYGIGNLYSVTHAFEHVGAEVEVTSDIAQVAAAERLVVPGVGAFRSCVDALADYHLFEALQDFAKLGRPMLGICVGMQMLFDRSNEFGITSGLGIIGGEVIGIPSTDLDERPHKIPHIGWTELRVPKTGAQWQGTILEGINPDEAAVYFVHSFTAHPTNPKNRLADALYDGRVISAVVREGTVYGCQFHPEKSGEVGLQIINNFLAVI